MVTDERLARFLRLVELTGLLVSWARGVLGGVNLTLTALEVLGGFN